MVGELQIADRRAAPASVPARREDMPSSTSMARLVGYPGSNRSIHWPALGPEIKSELAAPARAPAAINLPDLLTAGAPPFCRRSLPEVFRRSRGGGFGLFFGLGD